MHACPRPPRPLVRARNLAWFLLDNENDRPRARLARERTSAIAHLISLLYGDRCDRFCWHRAHTFLPEFALLFADHPNRQSREIAGRIVQLVEAAARRHGWT